MSLKEHRHAAVRSVKVVILTFTDSRDLVHDTAGQLISKALMSAGHMVMERLIVREQPELMVEALEKALNRETCPAVI